VNTLAQEIASAVQVQRHRRYTDPMRYGRKVGAVIRHCRELGSLITAEGVVACTGLTKHDAHVALHNLHATGHLRVSHQFRSAKLTVWEWIS
jgi:hypothetical protein